MNRYYGYEEFLKDSKKLLEKIKPYSPDTILIIARGGLSLGHILSIGLGVRQTYSINSISYDENKQKDDIQISNIPDLSQSKKILIVDDIIDSGRTMENVIIKLQSSYEKCNYKIATIFYKQTACISPEFYINEANEWIDFFWEKDIFER